MTVKEMVDLLKDEELGDLEVRVRCQWHGEAPAHDEFTVSHIARTMDSDTGEEVILLEGRQDG